MPEIRTRDRAREAVQAEKPVSNPISRARFLTSRKSDRRRAIRERAESEIPLDKVTEGWPVGTDPEVHVKILTDLFKGGATGVPIHSGQQDQRKVIDFYRKEVLPRLRQTLPKKAA